jgi:hypothetical protein
LRTIAHRAVSLSLTVTVRVPAASPAVEVATVLPRQRNATLAIVAAATTEES